MKHQPGISFLNGLISCLVLCTSVSSGCVSPGTSGSSRQAHEELMGAWEFLYSTSTYPDTVLTLDSNDVKSVYIINEEQFSFVMSDRATDKLLFAGYGRYSLNEAGDEYIEHIDYHSTPNAVGVSVKFDSKVDGDLWIHEGYVPVHESDRFQLELSKGEHAYHIREVRRRLK